MTRIEVGGGREKGSDVMLSDKRSPGFTSGRIVWVFIKVVKAVVWLLAMSVIWPIYRGRCGVEDVEKEVIL